LFELQVQVNETHVFVNKQYKGYMIIYYKRHP